MTRPANAIDENIVDHRLARTLATRISNSYEIHRALIPTLNAQHTPYRMLDANHGHHIEYAS